MSYRPLLGLALATLAGAACAGGRAYTDPDIKKWEGEPEPVVIAPAPTPDTGRRGADSNTADGWGTGRPADVAAAPAPARPGRTDSEGYAPYGGYRDDGWNADPERAADRAGATPVPADQGYGPGPVSGYGGYGNTTAGPNPVAHTPTGTIELPRLGTWSRSGIAESRRLVIRDADTWARFWSELDAGGQPPAVDFTRKAVVAVAMGQQRSGGYEIRIDKIEADADQFTVYVTEIEPGPNCLTTGAMTQPVDVVLIPATGDRTWSFLQRKQYRSCR